MERYDVAVIGLGPVGAAAAILFAEAGLRVAVVERDPEVFPLPRAVAMDGEAVRAFQAIGLGDALAALLQPIRPGDRAGFCNSRREWLFGAELTDFGRNGWPALSMFHQPEVDAWLRETAIRHPNVSARVGYALEGFEDRGDRVRLDVRATEGVADGPAGPAGPAGESVELEADWLVACDGANSGVRRRLGVAWRDLGYDRDWLVVDVEAKPGHTLGNDTLQVCDPDRLATFVVTKDPWRRWEFALNPGETREALLDPARIEALIEPWTPKGTYEIRRSAVYQFHAATAETWRVGRVLLAGDAAHQTPPFLGQGMNAGLRDVINLAWKLERVCRGASEDALIDTYPEERKPHAEDLVEWAVSVGQLMEYLAAVEAARRDGRPPPPEPEGKRSAGYGQGRDAPPLRSGVLRLEQVSDTGSTGYLFSQPIVEDEAGLRFRLDERLGRGFALVIGPGRDVALDPATRERLQRLEVRIVRLDGLQPVRGHFDRLFEASDVAIVRPDRYVFGHTSSTLDVAGLVEALAAGLAPT